MIVAGAPLRTEHGLFNCAAVIQRGRVLGVVPKSYLPEYREYYMFTAAGAGGSTTDLAWDGQALICENGELLAEAERFAPDEQLISADLDLDRIDAERAAMSSFGDAIHDHRDALAGLRRIEFELGLPPAAVPLRRVLERFP